MKTALPLVCRVLQTAALANVALLAATVTKQRKPVRSRPLASICQGQQGMQYSSLLAHWQHQAHIGLRLSITRL